MVLKMAICSWYKQVQKRDVYFRPGTLGKSSQKRLTLELSLKGQGSWGWDGQSKMGRTFQDKGSARAPKAWRRETAGQIGGRGEKVAWVEM